uniref:uncharacterized protein LOC122601462 n=1 Tax=Erigeron canadensis TaxID=72917 RepID=UPI001CB8BFB0|nr:uncharacterized protein LOC122601462 [Erigeron canadensis]
MANSKNIKTFPIMFKNHSWSPYIDHDKEWEKLKVKQNRRHHLHGCSKSLDHGDHYEFDVTSDDIKELRGCFDLGFGFDPCNELDPKLSSVFPALELYNTIVNRQINNRDLSSSSFIESNFSVASLASLIFVTDTNDEPNVTKMRLRQWAQVVAYSSHEACRQPKTKVAK